MIIYFVLCQDIHFIQCKFDHYFIHKNHSKDTLNQHKLCEIAKRKKTLWLALLIFFHGRTLSRIPLRPVLVSI